MLKSMGLSINKNTVENKRLFYLALAALGVVYGDIGTSPLYAMKQCFNPVFGLSLSTENILGILSLIFWALTVIIVIKYLTFVMRADNQGEGGIMALMALILSSNGKKKGTLSKRSILILLGIFGTSLLLADGIITPVISVLSAVEGLKVSTPILNPYIIPITLIILIALFLIQRHGTGEIGSIFGPCMVVWFIIIGLLGLKSVIKLPFVLEAMNPYFALKFFLMNSYQAFHVLAAVVLVVTGGEALYADMGHFGKKPIRWAWYVLVYPALILNYFGQGASLIKYGHKALINPFYFLAQGWMTLPMVVIATVATIIASQALISGAFSLAQQSMQLGYTPRLNIIHTSKEIHGQIYVPEINNFLMIACVALVVLFKNSTNLASAYGMAVMGTMTITTLLLYSVALKIWHWSFWKANILIGLFLIVDLSFLTANFTKFFSGGWVPFTISLMGFTIFTTWKRGQVELHKIFSSSQIPLTNFMKDIAHSKVVQRIKGTAVFMTANPDYIPHVLLHHIKHNVVLHEQIILLAIINERIPKVPYKKKVSINNKGNGFYQIIAHYGFMETPDIPEIFSICRKKRLAVDVQKTSFYLGRVTLLTHGRSRMAQWREKVVFLFIS